MPDFEFETLHLTKERVKNISNSQDWKDHIQLEVIAQLSMIADRLVKVEKAINKLVDKR